MVDDFQHEGMADAVQRHGIAAFILSGVGPLADALDAFSNSGKPLVLIPCRAGLAVWFHEMVDPWRNAKLVGVLVNYLDDDWHFVLTEKLPETARQECELAASLMFDPNKSRT